MAEWWNNFSNHIVRKQCRDGILNWTQLGLLSIGPSPISPAPIHLQPQNRWKTRRIFGQPATISTATPNGTQQTFWLFRNLLKNKNSSMKISKVNLLSSLRFVVFKRAEKDGGKHEFFIVENFQASKIWNENKQHKNRWRKLSAQIRVFIYIKLSCLRGMIEDDTAAVK